MSLLFTIIVTFFAGMGAGLGTGFAGMSAACRLPKLHYCPTHHPRATASASFSLMAPLYIAFPRIAP